MKSIVLMLIFKIFYLQYIPISYRNLLIIMFWLDNVYSVTIDYSKINLSQCIHHLIDVLLM